MKIIKVIFTGLLVSVSIVSMSPSLKKKQDKPVEKLLKKHQELTHSDMLKVASHVQREQGDWYVNTLMIDGYDVPFRYQRKKIYKNLTGQRVNLTYYPITESVAGFELELMKVVRVRVA